GAAAARRSSGGGAARRARQPPMPRVRPAAAVLLDQIGECLRMSGAGVERRDVLEAKAAGAHEGLAILDVDLLERLQAVDGETRAHDGDLAQSPGRHAVEHLDRVGLEPTGGTEARLKAHAPGSVRQQQLVRQQARGRLAALEVPVALLNVALRDAVEGDEE